MLLKNAKIFKKCLVKKPQQLKVNIHYNILICLLSIKHIKLYLDMSYNISYNLPMY